MVRPSPREVGHRNAGDLEAGTTLHGQIVGAGTQERYQGGPDCATAQNGNAHHWC